MNITVGQGVIGTAALAALSSAGYLAYEGIEGRLTATIQKAWRLESLRNLELKRDHYSDAINYFEPEYQAGTITSCGRFIYERAMIRQRNANREISRLNREAGK